MSRVAIMQPTFLPWLGYFAMIDLADDFVFLDNVQLTKRSWQVRNQILGPHGPIMLTLPVPRKPSRPLIVDARLIPGPMMQKLRDTLQGILGKAAYWNDVETLLTQAFAKTDGGLSAVNRTFIQSLCKMTGIEARFHLASELDLPPDTQSGKAENLLRICRHFSAREYLSAVGSYTYLSEQNPFEDSEVALRFFNYEHPVYPQPHEPFMPHMSAVEALAHVGPADFGALVRSGQRPSISFDDMENASD